jgi:hypothetical protein
MPVRLLLASSALAALLAACATAAPPAPDATVVFGVLGDVPYSAAEVKQLERLIDEMNEARLDFVVHVGDIGRSTGAQACGDAWVLARKQQFGRIRHPFVLLPGDNEWSDCKNPLERLGLWRKLFCKPTLEVVAQAGEYCEHVRWEAGGWVFVALNVPGHDNNVRHPEHKPRMKAVMAWLDEAAALAERREGLVVFMQANPFVTLPRDGFADIRERLEALGAKMPGRVLLVHGDTHLFKDDEPLPGVRRIEVWGSPFVEWVRLGL